VVGNAITVKSDRTHKKSIKNARQPKFRPTPNKELKSRSTMGDHNQTARQRLNAEHRGSMDE
jgi:hypothetical protein